MFGDIGKCSVRIFAILFVLSKIGNKQVLEPIVVIVAYTNTNSPSSVDQPCLLGDIGKGAVAVVAIPAEFAFDVAGIRTLHASSGETTTESGTEYVRGLAPGLASSIDLVSREGKSLRIVLLTQKDAEDAWKVHIDGSDHLLFTAQDFFSDAEAQPGRIWLRSRGVPQFAFSMSLHLSLLFRPACPWRKHPTHPRLLHLQQRPRSAASILNTTLLNLRATLLL